MLVAMPTQKLPEG